MAKLEKFLQRSTIEYEPVKHAGYTITPISQRLTFGVPHFQFSWNRPVAMRVDDGIEELQYPILDITRIVQLATWSLGFFIVILYWAVNRK